jgi:hypothetical protein
MTIVPLKNAGKLERLTMANWCAQYVGVEGAHGWFEVEPVESWFASDYVKYHSFRAEGMLVCMVFRHDTDAAAFKLVFGL